VVDVEVRPVVVDLARRQTHQDDVERLGEHGARLVRVVVDVLARGATAQSHLEPTSTELVEHADLLEQPHRIVQRQDVAQGAQTQPARALGDGRQEQVGRGHGRQLGGVVLGEVVAGKARPVGELEHPQTLLVRLALTAPGFVEPIEHGEPHRRARRSRHRGSGQCSVRGRGNMNGA
jgi:hypothetical protein